MKTWLLIQTLFLKAMGLLIIFFTDYNFSGWIIFFSAGAIVFINCFLPRSNAICTTYSKFISSEKEVWLTIDDGPHPETTPQLLNLLKKFDAKVTFFLIGNKIKKYPDLVRTIIQEGHEIGNHTFSHPLNFFWIASKRKTIQEISTTSTLIKEHHPDVHWFRSPAGIKNIWLAKILRKNQLKYLSWTIRSNDSVDTDALRIAHRVNQLAFSGAIILMHEKPFSLKSEEAILQTLKLLSKSGYKFVIPTRESVVSL